MSTPRSQLDIEKKIDALVSKQNLGLSSKGKEQFIRILNSIDFENESLDDRENNIERINRFLQKHQIGEEKARSSLAADIYCDIVVIHEKARLQNLHPNTTFQKKLIKAIIAPLVKDGFSTIVIRGQVDRALPRLSVSTSIEEKKQPQPLQQQAGPMRLLAQDLAEALTSKAVEFKGNTQSKQIMEVVSKLLDRTDWTYTYQELFKTLEDLKASTSPPVPMGAFRELIYTHAKNQASEQYNKLIQKKSETPDAIRANVLEYLKALKEEWEAERRFLKLATPGDEITFLETAITRLEKGSLTVDKMMDFLIVSLNDANSKKTTDIEHFKAIQNMAAPYRASVAAAADTKASPTIAPTIPPITLPITPTITPAPTPTVVPPTVTAATQPKPPMPSMPRPTRARPATGSPPARPTPPAVQTEPIISPNTQKTRGLGFLRRLFMKKESVAKPTPVLAEQPPIKPRTVSAPVPVSPKRPVDARRVTEVTNIKAPEIKAQPIPQAVQPQAVQPKTIVADLGSVGANHVQSNAPPVPKKSRSSDQILSNKFHLKTELQRVANVIQTPIDESKELVATIHPTKMYQMKQGEGQFAVKKEGDNIKLYSLHVPKEKADILALAYGLIAAFVDDQGPKATIYLLNPNVDPLLLEAYNAICQANGLNLVPPTPTSMAVPEEYKNLNINLVNANLIREQEKIRQDYKSELSVLNSWHLNAIGELKNAENELKKDHPRIDFLKSAMGRLSEDRKPVDIALRALPQQAKSLDEIEVINDHLKKIEATIQKLGERIIVETGKNTKPPEPAPDDKRGLRSRSVS